MAFRVTGLSAEPFRHLFGLSEVDLSVYDARRYVVDKTPGFPDRIEMRDCNPGETVLLLNHTCQPAETPYCATHAIFVREGATEFYDALDQIPDVMRVRLLSLRAFSRDGTMIDADVTDGKISNLSLIVSSLIPKPATFTSITPSAGAIPAGSIELDWPSAADKRKQ